MSFIQRHRKCQIVLGGLQRGLVSLESFLLKYNSSAGPSYLCISPSECKMVLQLDMLSEDSTNEQAFSVDNYPNHFAFES